MASTSQLSELVSKASYHLTNARPFAPMYIHLILSALFPIYTGAHASLSRPSSAAEADKKKKTDPDDEDEDEDKIQKMEGMSNKDAIVLPITAGLVLAGLYFLIMKYGADMINLIMGYYFSGVGLYSVAKLVNDGLNIIVSFVYPTYYASGGSLWKVVGSEHKAIRQDGTSQTRDTPDPSPEGNSTLPGRFKSTLWNLRSDLQRKYAVSAYIHNMVDVRAKLTMINLFSALFGAGTIIYVNVVSKPWFLTNLQGFAVSYSALQLMSPTTFATGSLILGSLFCYDIWAVFFTPLMVTVAKNLDQPIKLVFPRPDEPSPTPGEPSVRSYSMLGLGDIVLPGIMIGLALRFDLYLFYLKKQKTVRKSVGDASGESTIQEVTEKAPYVSVTGHWGDRFWTRGLSASSLPAQICSSFPKPYFSASMVGYVIGMLTTLGVMSVFQHAQPALLYLVPGVLISLWGTALVKGEAKEMWDFSEAVTGEQIEEGGESESKKDAQKDEESSPGLFERLWQEIWRGSKEEDHSKSDETQTKDASTSDKEKKEKSESESEKKADVNKGVLFSFSVARNDANSKSSSTTPGKADKPLGTDPTHSSSRSESSDDAVVVSSNDLDDTKESGSAPRYRTRSTRSNVNEGGLAM